ncbi:MAG TPA: helix-turn-helix domain-containing protein [Luteitalea sp.]|nr:helix-turn-helix domain-containing protein [Luteitalea sp.]
MFLARPPRPPLDRCVSVLWTCRQSITERRFERVLPTATAQLIVNLAEDETRSYDPADVSRCMRGPAMVITGPSTTHGIIDTDEQAHVAGVCFTPTGLLDVVPAPASLLAGQDVALDDLWPARMAQRLREQLLEAPSPQAQLDLLEEALRAMFRDRPAHAAVRHATTALAARPDVARIGELAEASGLSQRHFIECFTREVGVTPKRFARVQRFQQVVQRAHRGQRDRWCDIAADGGFADQSHLVHEFREFAGLTPTAWERLRTDHHNHVRFLQDDAEGGLQGSAA